MQAVSGNGYPGLSYLDIDDNVIPYIAGEEEKIEEETCLLLGKIDGEAQVAKAITVSAQANRVPVVDGHMVSLSIGFERKPTVEEAVEVLSAYRGPEIVRSLPGAPEQPVIVRHELDRPQPRRDRNTSNGMVTTVGRVRACPLLDLRMVAVTHNAIRGAVGGAVLNAELLIAGGHLA